ncbi:hypothetical protein GQ53DRAFT_828613 [Thozetella sp. PMI_491]|nr:hypothetical protein GQ53DRAFT_828613 [Thozetella sp. PMI_491]
MKSIITALAFIASTAFYQFAAADVVMVFTTPAGDSVTSPIIDTNQPLDINSSSHSNLLNVTTARILAGEDVQFCAYFEGFCSSPSNTPFGRDTVTLKPHTNPQACLMCFEQVVVEQAKAAGLI